jgi:hypothetical protein
MGIIMNKVNVDELSVGGLKGNINLEKAVKDNNI